MSSERSARVARTAGSVRITGSGTLELAYVAAGRLHGWIQPATYRWDWVPGALLVTEAGGRAERTPTDPDWCIAAAPRALRGAARAHRLERGEARRRAGLVTHSVLPEG